MAERGIDQKEEKKSYASVFLIGASLLVALTVWAIVDDNFTRRPWKGIQAQFYRLDYSRAKAAYEQEDKKLQAEPNYLELSKIGDGAGELKAAPWQKTHRLGTRRS